MKKIILFLIVFFILAGVTYAVTYSPAVTNQIARSVPEFREAAQPPSDVSEQKVGNEIGKIVSSEFVRTYSMSEVTGYLRSYLAQSRQAKSAEYEVDYYSITYNTTDENNVLLTNKAQLYVPKAAGETLPIYVFGSGTTGLNDPCAPSKEVAAQDNWGDYRAHMLSYASQGYIVVFPDYEGFNDGPERIHHYFHKRYEAHVLLDAARATYDFFAKEQTNAKPKKAIFFAGYSQGGHAAFAVSDLADEYAPELPVKGVIGYGSTTNVLRLLQEGPQFAPYIIVAYQDTYGEEAVDASKILNERFVPTLREDAVTKCVSAMGRYYPSDAAQMYTPEFRESLKNDLNGEFSAFRDLLLKNSTGLEASRIPGLILQGGTDPIVTNKTQEEFIRQSCAKGNTLTYNNYPGVHHFQSRQVSFSDTLQWMEDRVAGKPVKNDCGSV